AASGFDLDDEDSPFGELFKQNPQFRELFRDRQRNREMPRTRGMGSGFIIDETGVILTNSHVLRGADEVKVRLHDGHEYAATEIKMDDKSDVAILRISGAKGLKALKFGDSDAAEIGDWVLAVGNPYDVGMTVTAGIISGKGRGLGIADREDFLQTDAAINPGNSGGPLLNLNGEVIGVNTAISSRSGGSEGIGFAIPVNMVKWVSQQLVAGGKVKRAYLGIGIQQLDPQVSKGLKLQGLDGAIVTTVAKDSPAEAAKLQEGDVILELNSRRITSPRSLQNTVERLEVGKTYKALIIRDGEKLELPITVREMPDDFFIAGRNGGRRGLGKGQSPKEESFNELGVQVKEITPEMAKEFGYDEKVTGLVVTNVDPKGAAALAGISAGQIIEKVGTKKIASAKDLEEALKGASLKEGVTLLISTPTGKRFVAVQINGK
ncbi:MAG TPA: Do family serine endopeptidase, partial [Planctomycetaceae bacterium]|nr:Do family serine endopeptidase [Planctomycetaceae bacterium]